MVDPGEGPGGLGPPPYFYTSEARRAGKCFFETGPPISAPPPGSVTENNQDAAQGLFAPKTGKSDELRER